MGPAGDEDHEGPPDDRDDDRGDGRDLGRDDDPMGAEDDRPRGAPPDRMDRIWVHPTELSPVRPPSRSRARVGRFVTPLAAGALGAIVAIGVLGLLGAFDNGGGNAASVPPEEQFGPQRRGRIAPGRHRRTRAGARHGQGRERHSAGERASACGTAARS